MKIELIKSIIKLLLRLVQFVCFGIWPIPYTSAYKSSEADYWKLMGIDEPCLEWVLCMPGTTVQEYPVLSRNVPLPGLTICPKVLVYARTGIKCHHSPQEYIQGITAHPAGKQGSRGASTPHGSAWWPPDRILGISCTTFVWPP